MQKELANLDIVCAKLDAPDEKIFQKINSPHPQFNFAEILKGIKAFRQKFTGKFALQMMFLKENRQFIEEMAELSQEIAPDEVQINTPMRVKRVSPLSEEEIARISAYFRARGLKVVSVYEEKEPEVKILDPEQTRKRRPQFYR